MTARERVKAAMTDYLQKHTHYNSGIEAMTQTKAKTSSISLWKNKKDDSKLRLYGAIQVTEELLEELNGLEPNERGQFELRVALFRNNSDNSKAPILKGRIELPQEEADDEF